MIDPKVAKFRKRFVKAQALLTLRLFGEGRGHGHQGLVRRGQEEGGLSGKGEGGRFRRLSATDMQELKALREELDVTDAADDKTRCARSTTRR
jgi:hypothetical protein